MVTPITASPAALPERPPRSGAERRDRDLCWSVTLSVATQRWGLTLELLAYPQESGTSCPGKDLKKLTKTKTKADEPKNPQKKNKKGTILPFNWDF